MTIRLVRRSGASFLRKIDIFIDGEKIGELSPNSSLEYEFSKKNVSVCAKLDWIRSNTLEVTGEQVEIHLVEFSPIYPTLHKILIIISIVVSFILVLNDDVLFINIAAAFLFAYITFFFTRYLVSAFSKGNKRFLFLKNIKFKGEN